MRRHQTLPVQWLVINGALEQRLCSALRRLPHGSGILIIGQLEPEMLQRIKSVAKLRCLQIAEEGRTAAVRVHSARELTRALIGRPTIVLLSPMYETATHPGWKPLPRMRAAALARLCPTDVLALGGMSAQRYRTVASLGFAGWAGISAFRT